MELLRDYHAMFWAFFFLPPSFDFKSDSVSVFHSHFAQERELCIKKKCLVHFSCLTHLAGSKANSLQPNLGTAEQVFQEVKKKNSGKKYFSFLALFF